MTGHALIIPPVGIMQVLHGDHDGEQVLRDLFTYLGEGHYDYVSLHFTAAEGGVGTLGFFPTLTAVNHRAQEALRILTDAHMLLTGPVVFTGVPQPRLGLVVARLSVEEH